MACGPSQEEIMKQKVMEEYEQAQKDLEEEMNDLRMGFIKDSIDYSNVSCENWIYKKEDKVTGKTQIRNKNTISLGRTFDDRPSTEFSKADALTSPASSSA